MGALILAADTDFGWYSLLPPLVAIGLSIVTRRVILSLLVGIVVATGLIAWDRADGWVELARFWPKTTLVDLLWKNLADPSHLLVFGFTMFMGMMVAVMQRNGSMNSLVGAMSGIVRGRRSCQLITWLLGLIVFFDDYANSLLLGGSMQPLCDRWRVSREKLAYLVDSTAAPVAGLALISTWVAGEIGYIEAGFAKLPAGVSQQAIPDGLAIFVSTIPYRFYVLLALLLVPVAALLGRDLGPMWRAENRAIHRDRTRAGGGTGSDSATANDNDVRRAPWLAAVLPVVVVVLLTLGLLYAGGATPPRDVTRYGLPWWIAVIGGGDSYLSLFYGSLAGLFVSIALSRLYSLSWADVRAATWVGIRVVTPALGILWMAWTLSEVTEDKYLGTGTYLGQWVQGRVAAPWLPTVVFVLASLTAFSTGTSWGTMGILTPLVVPATYQVLASSVADPVGDPIMLATVGGVLSGAIFGDHCSPISDTTVLSSQASGCEHVAHVWTQLPYALLAAVVAVVFGTIPVGYGAPAWTCLLSGAVAMTIGLRVLGKRYES